MSRFDLAKRLKIFFSLAALMLAVPAASLARPNFNVDSLNFRSIPGTRGCWGYVDSASQREYALMCAGSELQIWEVTNPASPTLTKRVFASTGAFDLKQVRPYSHYLFAVNQGGVGLQVIRVDSIAINPVKTVETVANYQTASGAQGAHALHIDGHYAYLGMNGNFPATWRIIDISNPLAPVEVGSYQTPQGGFNDSHDSYVKGDTAYVAFLGGGFSVVDITDKANPVPLSNVIYPGAFTHNCWPTEDGRYLFTTDENTNGHLHVWDVLDPANPLLVAEWKPPVPLSIIHNVQVKGNYLYASYYTEGVSILDIEDATQPVEVGHYDTAPASSGAGFTGCWDFFPYFPSGTLVASNLSSPPGMWLLRFNPAKPAILRGAVANWKTGDPLPGAAIRFPDYLRQTKTDPAGNFLARSEADTTVRVEFSLAGFRSETLAVMATFGDKLDLDTVRLIPLSEFPAAPQNLSAQPVQGGNILLSWKPPADTDLLRFRIYRSLPEDTTTVVLFDSVNAPETTYTDIGTVAGERFRYYVSALDTSGFESSFFNEARAMRFVFGTKLLLVNRTAPPTNQPLSFRDTIQSFYLRALRRFDYDTLNLRDESFQIPAGISPGFVAQNPVIYSYSAELRSVSDNPLFLSYFTDFMQAGGKLVMDGHWALGGVNVSYLKCLASDPPFPGAQVWNGIRNAFGFDCLFFPRIFPFDTSLVNRSFLSARPEQNGYPVLVADSTRGAAGLAAYIAPPPTVVNSFPTLPNVGYLTNRNPAEDLYTFGSIDPVNDPKQGLTVAKKHIDASGGGFIWFNFPLFYMNEDSAKKAIRQALSDLGVTESFPKGDLNRDGMRNLPDVAYFINFVFDGLPFPVLDADEADLNCDGAATPVDVVLILYDLFLSQPLPCE